MRLMRFMGHMIDLTQQNKKIKKPLKKEKAAIKRGQVKEIDEVFQETEEKFNSLKKIEKPEIKEDKSIIFKQLIILFFLAIFIFGVYKIFFKSTNSPSAQEQQTERWYMVKLNDGEVFYGQISDTAADPVIIRNVYYDYDQLKGEDSKKENTGGNLRLVKRGKETYGPDGTIHIVRDQILYMEPLRDDSKVLKAILEYEGR